MKEGYLLSAQVPGDDPKDMEKHEKEDRSYEAIGLVPGHSYSVIRVAELELEGEKRPLRLILIRSLWNNFVWKGAWSKADKKWTPEVEEALGLQEATKENSKNAQNSFWLSDRDFYNNFHCVTVCQVRNWEQARVKGKFVTV